MKFEDAFAPDVSVRDFFEEYLPDLFESRRDAFDRYSEAPLRISMYLTDRDTRYSFELSADGLRATEGELIDFPVVTLEGTAEQWETLRAHMRDLADRLESRVGDRTPPNRITRRFLDELERHDGVIELEVEDDDTSLSVRCILNDYQAPPRAREVRLACSMDLLYDVVEGDRSPADAARSADMSGDLSLAFDLGGLLMSHFPELDRTP